ncbi:MAG: M20/M25/M40 family metallo-hydrolase [Ignavibacteriaceae bacterium]
MKIKILTDELRITKSFKQIFLILFLIVFSIKVCSQSSDSGLESIKSEELLQTVKTLTSPELDGRLPGSEGYNKAANFVAEKFSRHELIPAGDDGYFQYLNVEYNKIDTPVVFNLIKEGNKIPFVFGKDFVFRGFTGSGNLALPVAFCGYGISRPDLGYDDYKNIDVNDKIVLVFKQNPSWKIKETNWGNEYPRQKSRVAYEHGAKGILFVSRPNDKKIQPLIGSVMHGEGEQLENFPQLQISPEAANEFIVSSGYSLSECQMKIDAKEKPFSFLTRREAEIKVRTEYIKSTKTMNVVGKIEGTDPALKNEYLIIGAHLDHVGSQAGLLFPGANDNASGSAGVIQLAKAFQDSQLKPKRSILFVLFASEEQGLFGSKHFVENLKIKPDKIVAMFNMDCIGYGDSIQIGNGKSAPELWKIADSLDQEIGRLMVRETWNGGGADATPFYEKGIPCLYFASKYSYDYLHQPTDIPETLNTNLFESIVRLAYLTAREVVDGKYKREKIIK